LLLSNNNNNRHNGNNGNNVINDIYSIDCINYNYKINTSNQQQNKTVGTLSGLKILDVDCGGGLLSESLARLGGQVTGIDASTDLIQAVQAHASLDWRFRASNDASGPPRLQYM
jgi:2-polyprenyl-3-methyl-5-hydroxy-6-metoxy-1,4-benzoquinol methylase